MPPKENVGHPKAKWHPPRVKECEVRCLLTQIHVNHLRYPSIKTPTKKMMSRDRRRCQGPPKTTSKGERAAITSPSDVKTPSIETSSILCAKKIPRVL
jgi:hypothetical protein